MEKPTQESLDLLRKIATKIPTFHHHYHIIFDLINEFKGQKVNYVEIGAYAGASASLSLQHDNISVFSIDIGTPIPFNQVVKNILDTQLWAKEKPKKYNSTYEYIQGDSTSQETKNRLLEKLNNEKINILFIDGDHSFDAVIKDFNNYFDLVDSKGYIVFDDYNDEEFSPDVKHAVDFIVQNNNHLFDVIGTFKNELGAYPSELKEGNCFVIRKK
jgi:cephalosporin hydroxylase